MLANQPGFLPGHMLGYLAIGSWAEPSATRIRMAAKRAARPPLVPRRQLTLRHGASFLYLMGRNRELIGYRMHPGWAASPGRKHEFHIGGIDFRMTWHSNRPTQVPRAPGLTERCGQAIIGIRMNTAKTDTCGTEAINLFDSHLRFGSGTCCSSGTPARFRCAGYAVQMSGRNRRSDSISGTSREASVTDTSV